MQKTSGKRMVITGRIWEEDGWWFSAADKLPVAGFGKTPNEAMARANEAVAGFIAYLERTDEFQEAFEHYGILKGRKRPARYGFSIEMPAKGEPNDLVSA